MTVKQKNKRNVLGCIREHSPISRAEIAVKARISKPTVSLLVDELLKEKLVFEKGIGESSSQGGRRPIQLYFNEKAFFIVGTDIGGTKVKTIISDLGGNIIASSSFKTGQYLNSGLLRQISKEIDCLIERNGIDPGKVLGMGAGIPGITETEMGIVTEAPSLNWIRYPFIAEAKQIFPFPVYVDNDVNVAALGEQWLGNAKNKRNVLFIAVGTGIGSGIIIHNKLYRGASYAAGELGYMVTDKNDMNGDFTPVFHRYGYLESVAGGKAIGARLTKAVLGHPGHPLYEEAKEAELPGEMAFKLAKSGDKTALAVLDEAVGHLAYGIINAASLLNPEVIILGGGVFKSADMLLPKLKEIVNQYLPSPPELKISQLGENAGALGAVSLFLREHESIFKI
ncbi:ROK family transcriptional regulator [Neobacillus piezotolerans]|uniref:ROK family transcriptional regulator n=1 Tax=Neobacillus piezotolerans TaxID=2259171 RepID=A0A3D8GSF5_9BACI|nr:ROK family transcriptional regulator [Neobacillus piezotolerans]RDU37232.1 ROK family transcriptional regulator [Neobacillus piezotolerans]